MFQRLFLAMFLVLVFSVSSALAVERSVEDNDTGVMVIDPDKPSGAIGAWQFMQTQKKYALWNYNQFSVIVDCYQIDYTTGVKNFLWSNRIEADGKLSGVHIYPNTEFEVRDALKGYLIGRFK